jgi:hypothetical protein
MYLVLKDSVRIKFVNLDVHFDGSSAVFTEVTERHMICGVSESSMEGFVTLSRS